ncbi:MAG: phenylalanine--tRNA ligase subunit beta [Actinobacteria bacterium]|nr:MAG: phenylalanine--tRNA ligase subunit beta [Actinomycetota bacterium]
MRAPASWLRDYCNPQLPTRDIADRLNMTGSEVGRIEHAGVPDADEFVVGKVIAAEPHPNADRLTVCEVEDGSGTARTIVCGAPNVAAGQTVAVARPGATMADGSVLAEAELRGVVSHGMILAEDEVGIGEDHAGIMVLPDDLPPGAPLAEHLPIADEVLDLEIAPNRPDCLGVYGLAREVHATTGAPLAEDPTAADVDPSDGDGGVEVEIADPDICLRFTARVFDHVTIGPSPLWLKARLTAAGQRPINNVVDITNYVMLLTAQPLHAFDLDRVRGGRIVVRRARDRETMTTLDGVERTFTSEAALVCDGEGPSGIAGIMGGQVSEVSASTTRVLMESATWVGTNILRTSGRLGLRTEASTRFEKQLHPDLAMAAQRLAARLMVELCGARLLGETIDAYPRPVEPRRVGLRTARVGSLLGTEVPVGDIVAILERLGFGIDGSDGTLEALVPPWRFSDIEREVDLIEEVGRVYGLDRLPATLPARRRAVGRLTPAQRLRRRLEDALRDRGLVEAVSYSFVAPGTLARLRLPEEAIRLANPLSEEHSVMRPLILPGLLDGARWNAAHGRTGARLFECAHVYPPPATEAGANPRGAVPVAEREHLAVLLAGPAEGGWRTAAPPADFHAAKGLLEAVLDAAAVEVRFERAEPPFLHPGRAASVVSRDGRELGFVGEVHPAVLRDWDLEVGAAFEVDAGALAELAPGAVHYREVTSFPAVLQDIAVVVPEEVPAAEVEAAVRVGGGELLAEARIFDVYHGEQVGEGERSLALRLRFQAPDRTLTDEDVAELRSAIESRVAELGGRLRA